MPVELTQKPSDIQLNDYQEIDQILGNPPIIEAPVKILTENPAIRIIPLASGKLEELLVENQQPVKKGQLLAIIESPISKNGIIILEKNLVQVENCSQPNDYLMLRLAKDLQLGDLQNQYARLIQQVEDYQYFLKQKSNAKKIKILKKQIVNTETLNKTLKNQQKHLVKEVKIAEKNFIRNQKLKQESVISDVEMEQIETAYLQYKRQLDDFESQAVTNQMQIEQLAAQIIDLQQNRKDKIALKISTINEVTQNLKSQLELWKQNYWITASIRGKINFSEVWSENQFVQLNKELFTIVPNEGAGKMIAKAQLPIANSGKVKIGQTANIKLNSFPYQEYGILKSTVAEIGLVPSENYYSVELAMPKSLITTYNKEIPFTQEMIGTANIVTEDRRVLQRIFDQLLNILKNT